MSNIQSLSRVYIIDHLSTAREKKKRNRQVKIHKKLFALNLLNCVLSKQEIEFYLN